MPKGKFSEKVVIKVGQRACYHCSHCRNLTAGPHTDPDKATITGQAAHIRAANLGGPRYADQTDKERHGASNAIWLCCNCHKKVDTDWKEWPAQKLLDMKTTHEKWLAEEEIIPKLPTVTVTTRSGLSALPGVTITGEDCERYREHHLLIQNPNKVELHNLQAEVRLPEKAVRAGIDAPPGIDVRFRPRPTSMQAFVKGKGASVTVPPQQPTSLCQLGIDKLPAQTQIEVVVWTIGQPLDEGLSPDLWGSMYDDPDVIEHFINGTFQFTLRNEDLTRTFFVPLVGDTEKRTVTAEPVRESPAPKQITVIAGFNI